MPSPATAANHRDRLLPSPLFAANVINACTALVLFSADDMLMQPSEEHCGAAKGTKENSSNYCICLNSGPSQVESVTQSQAAKFRKIRWVVPAAVCWSLGPPLHAD